MGPEKAKEIGTQPTMSRDENPGVKCQEWSDWKLAKSVEVDIEKPIRNSKLLLTRDSRIEYNRR